jgi:uncharacterized membrane-anchored protein YjiN (DUF445 family)
MTSHAMPSTLSLSAEESDVLRTVVGDALSSLRDEVYKTENYEMRQDLKRREMLLVDLLQRLGA